MGTDSAGMISHRIRVLAADGHAAMREGAQAALEQAVGLEWLGAVESGEAAVAVISPSAVRRFAVTLVWIVSAVVVAALWSASGVGRKMSGVGRAPSVAVATSGVVGRGASGAALGC